MKPISLDYKDEIKRMGRQIDSKITYTINNETIELGVDDLNSITLHYEGDILKSVMKQLDIDSNVDIPIDTILTYKFGLKVNGEYEYINYGNFVVYSSEKQEDLNSYKLICYDKMLYTMKDYENIGITYPTTIRDYLKKICEHLNLKFKNLDDEFVNYDKLIPSELYLDTNGNSLNYTFRDVLSELAQVTASTICINDNDELELRYINNTSDTIDEEYLKDTNVNFGEVFGPVNTISIKRSADSDIISKSIPEDLSNDEKIEIAISDNQILNDDNRADYIDEILNQLYGLTYSINDYVSTGITYLDLCDTYNVIVGENNYKCIMFNDEIQVTQGLVENVYTNKPDESTTDYNTTTKDDRTRLRTTLKVNKIEGNITALVEETKELNATVNGVYEYRVTEDYEFKDEKDYYKLEETKDNTFQDQKEYYKLINDNYVKLIAGIDYDIGDKIPIEDFIYEFNVLEVGIDYNVGDNIKDIGFTVYENVLVGGYSNQISNLENSYSELFDEVAKKANTDDVNIQITNVENRVTSIIESTYTKTEIQEIANGTYVDESGKEVNVTTVVSESGTFDKNGLLIQKEGENNTIISDTLGRFNERGVQVKKVSNGIEGEEIFFGGYVHDDRFNTETRNYKNSAIVYTKNLIASGETIIGTHGLILDYEDEEGNQGSGWFNI